MFMTFLVFQRNLDAVLARGKGLKSSVHRDLFKTKNPKILQGLHLLTLQGLCPGPAGELTAPRRLPSAFYAPSGVLISLWPN